MLSASVVAMSTLQGTTTKLMVCCLSMYFLMSALIWSMPKITQRKNASLVTQRARRQAEGQRHPRAWPGSHTGGPQRGLAAPLERLAELPAGFRRIPQRPSPALLRSRSLPDAHDLSPPLPRVSPHPLHPRPAPQTTLVSWLPGEPARQTSPGLCRKPRCDLGAPARLSSRAPSKRRGHRQRKNRLWPALGHHGPVPVPVPLPTVPASLILTRDHGLCSDYATLCPLFKRLLLKLADFM